MLLSAIQQSKSAISQFSHSVMSDSLWPHGLQHSRLPCPSPTRRAYSNSCPSHQWCHPAISCSVVPFSSCLQSFPASGSFPVIWLFASGGYSIGASASASVLPVSIQGWFPLGLTGLISLQSKGLLVIFNSTAIWKHQFFGAQPSLWSISHICTWLLEKPLLWLYGPLLAKWCFCFSICYLGFSKFSYISQSLLCNFMAAVTIHSGFGAPQNKIWHCFHFFPFSFPWSDGTGSQDLSFLNVEF